MLYHSTGYMHVPTHVSYLVLYLIYLLCLVANWSTCTYEQLSGAVKTLYMHAYTFGIGLYDTINHASPCTYQLCHRFMDDSNRSVRTCATTRGGVDFDDLASEKVLPYYAFRLKTLDPGLSLYEARGQLVQWIDDTLRDIETQSDKKVAKFYIGKTYTHQVRRRRFNPSDPTTWRKGGISSRWHHHKEQDYGKSGLVVLTNITRNIVPEQSTHAFKHQELYALALEQQLITHYAYIKGDQRMANTSTHPGMQQSRDDVSGAIGYPIYLAYALEDTNSASDNESSTSHQNNSEQETRLQKNSISPSDMQLDSSPHQSTNELEETDSSTKVQTWLSAQQLFTGEHSKGNEHTQTTESIPWDGSKHVRFKSPVLENEMLQEVDSITATMSQPHKETQQPNCLRSGDRQARPMSSSDLQDGETSNPGLVTIDSDSHHQILDTTSSPVSSPGMSVCSSSPDVLDLTGSPAAEEEQESNSDCIIIGSQAADSADDCQILD